MSATSQTTRARSTGRPPGGGGSLARRLVIAGVVLGGIGVCLAIAPGGYNPFGPVKALVLLIAAAVVTAGLALDRESLSSGIERTRKQPVAWVASAFVLIALLATWTSIDRSQSAFGHYPEYQGLALLLLAVLIGFGAYVLADDRRLWKYVGRAALVALLIVSAYGIAQYLGWDPVPSLLQFVVRRVRSTPGNASNLGVWLVMALPLAVARVRAERGVWKWLAWAAVAAGVVTLALSLSRGAWIGAGLAIVTWLAVEGRHWDRGLRLKVVAAVVAVALVGTAAVALLVPNAASRVGELADPTAGTPGWRAEVWSLSVKLVETRPVLGWGPGSFRYAFPPVRTAQTLVGETGSQVVEDPHNILASAAAAAGVPGVLALVVLAVMVIVAAWRLPEESGWRLAGPALAAGIVGGLAALQFHFVTLDTAPLLALLAGLAAGRASLRAPRKTPPALTQRANVVARLVAAAATVALLAAAVLAGGLVAADYALASGFGLVTAQAPWPAARAQFERAGSLAPWEPAMQWALGRGATQWMSLTRDGSAFPDARDAMLATTRRLPVDPLVAAQTAEMYLVGGLANRDPVLLPRALTFANRAIALDPMNGYRWETKGTILATLGDTSAAIDALLTSVRYAPADRQAWSTLASVYTATKQTARAADAQAHADALPATGGSPSGQ
jgi:O-antigen ligase